ncbi:ZIP zinc transporter-domain-containing protein, partial [Pilaira anomala]
MLNAFIWLLLLCIAMLVASFVAGCIPLATKLSESKLNILTSVSVGLLISTSLVVIIPEGVETLYNKMQLNQPNVANHTAVGIALLVGFALMFMIDQVSSMHIHPSSTKDTEPSTTHQEIQSVTPTIGLIVHAAADGIALGASVTDPQLSMVVFFAIMLHKAPSAFALTTVLLSEGLSRTRVRHHLLMFSISAPAGAISTYLLLQLFYDQFDALNLVYWTGILLLFSGGTFLYVAMHSIQELPHKKYVDWTQLGAIVLGMMIPFVLNMNHSH